MSQLVGESLNFNNLKINSGGTDSEPPKTHVSLWDVRVLVSRVVLCVLFDLLLQARGVSPLVLIHSDPVPEEQEGGCG